MAPLQKSFKNMMCGLDRSTALLWESPTAVPLDLSVTLLESVKAVLAFVEENKDAPAKHLEKASKTLDDRKKRYKTAANGGALSWQKQSELNRLVGVKAAASGLPDDIFILHQKVSTAGIMLTGE